MKNVQLLLILTFLSAIGCSVKQEEASISGKPKFKPESYSVDTLNFPSMRYYHCLEKIENKNKPLLIFFNSYGCINCRKTEKILRDSIGLNNIATQFEFINLYVDDRRLMDKEDWFEYRGMIGKRIAFENFRIQTELINTGSQPYLVIVKKDSLIRFQGYGGTEKHVLDFLLGIN